MSGVEIVIGLAAMGFIALSVVWAKMNGDDDDHT